MPQMTDPRFGDSTDLERIGAELGAAIRRDHHSRSRRRTTMRLAVAGAVVAGVVLGVVGFAFKSAPSAPPAASAETIRRAVAALAVGPGTIVRVAVTATETGATGVMQSWFDDAWLGYPLGGGETRPNLPLRQIIRHDGVSVETGVFGRRLFSRTDYYLDPGAQLYNPLTHTIYELQPVDEPNGFPMSGDPAGCQQDLNADMAIVGAPSTNSSGLTRARARRYYADELIADVYPGARPFMSAPDRPGSSIPNLWSPCAAQELAHDVHAGGVKLVGSKTVDGRRVIEFRAANGSWTYYADAHSYRPVRLDVKGIDASGYPQGQPPERELVTLTFNVRAYDQVPLRGNEKLLSVTAQHPGARIDTKAADYYSTQARLFPPG
jgi:hypothetical protein